MSCGRSPCVARSLAARSRLRSRRARASKLAGCPFEPPPYLQLVRRSRGLVPPDESAPSLPPRPPGACSPRPRRVQLGHHPGDQGQLRLGATLEQGDVRNQLHLRVATKYHAVESTASPLAAEVSHTRIARLRASRG